MRFNRICIPLWALRHAAGDTIECSVNTHPVGLEFRATMNAELLHSRVFFSARELMESAERSRSLLESKGWAPIESETNS